MILTVSAPGCGAHPEAWRFSPAPNAPSLAWFRALTQIAERQPMTIRDAARIMIRSRVHQSFVGTPDQLADHMAQWLHEGGSDGFNILPPFFPGELALFVDQVVPALQKRGVFRRDYTGPTLRDHLGLPRPLGRPSARA